MGNDDTPSNKADERLAVVLAMLAEMDEAVERLPETHRAFGRAAVARVRCELDLVLLALGRQH